MTFDGEDVHTSEIPVSAAFYFVVVDLCATKDTMIILSDLSKAYPVPAKEGPSAEIERGVHEFLGPINAELMSEARQALEAVSI